MLALSFIAGLWVGTSWLWWRVDGGLPARRRLRRAVTWLPLTAWSSLRAAIERIA